MQTYDHCPICFLAKTILLRKSLADNTFMTKECLISEYRQLHIGEEIVDAWCEVCGIKFHPRSIST